MKVTDGKKDNATPRALFGAKQTFIECFHCRMIVSNSDATYLDCGYAGWVTDGHNWCSPYKGWQVSNDLKQDTVFSASNAMLFLEMLMRDLFRICTKTTRMTS